MTRITDVIVKGHTLGTTDDYRKSPGGEGPLAYQWEDKPHRHVYDLCGAVEEQAAEIASLRAALDAMTAALRHVIGTAPEPVARVAERALRWPDDYPINEEG